MTDLDSVALRRFVYDTLLSTGLPPRASAIGERFGVSESEAKQRLATLGIGKTILTHPVTGEISMAGPFAAEPTSYQVIGAHQRWWANCAWDALGVAVIANEPVRVEASCTDCGERTTIDVDPARGVESSWVVHFLLPARRWYEDIGFT